MTNQTTGDIYTILNSLKIEYSDHQHQAVFTCEESAVVDATIKGARSKNLFIKGRTTGKYYLVILECSKRADLKKIQEILGEKKISFASPEELLKYLALTPGSVSPFGLINDTNQIVNVLIDQEFWNNDLLSFHPNTNTATVELSKKDFLNFLSHTGHTQRVIQI
jgi:Ala-tRNA(Pro) deacylase